MTPLRRLAAVVLAAVSITAACGRAPDPLVAPAVPEAVVPSVVTSVAGLTIRENATAEVRRAFRSVGPTSVVKEGRVWEIREGERLVGMLELASISRRADTRRESDRAALRRQILTGEPTELDFSGVPVYETTDGALSVFVWFGRQMFGTLTLRGVDSQAVSDELVTTILQHEQWPDLSAEDFEER